MAARQTPGRGGGRNRTHRTGITRPTRFEDEGGHQTPFTSRCSSQGPCSSRDRTDAAGCEGTEQTPAHHGRRHREEATAARARSCPRARATRCRLVVRLLLRGSPSGPRRGGPEPRSSASKGVARWSAVSARPPMSDSRRAGSRRSERSVGQSALAATLRRKHVRGAVRAMAPVSPARAWPARERAPDPAAAATPRSRVRVWAASSRGSTSSGRRALLVRPSQVLTDRAPARPTPARLRPMPPPRRR